MLLNLIANGHLPWWQYLVVAGCILVLLAGTAALAVIWRTRPHGRKRG